jgi:nitric oxide reductase subunit B
MVLMTLFPGGILQMVDVLNNGYWHARSPAFLGGSLIKFIEWIRIVPDLIFGIVGVIPVVLAALLTYLTIRKQPATA